MLPLTRKELKSPQDTTECYIYRKIFIKNLAKDKNHRKVRDHYVYTGKYRSAAHDICSSIFNIPSNCYVVFQNGSSSDNHYIITELATEF